MRVTAATNALDHQVDIAKVQEWLGHANIATTRIYDHRKTRPEDSLTFKLYIQGDFELATNPPKFRKEEIREWRNSASLRGGDFVAKVSDKARV